LSDITTAYFYAVVMSLKEFLQISSYNDDVPQETKEFSNSFFA